MKELEQKFLNQVWKTYDMDGSGDLDSDEIRILCNELSGSILKNCKPLSLAFGEVVIKQIKSMIDSIVYGVMDAYIVSDRPMDIADFDNLNLSNVKFSSKN